MTLSIVREDPVRLAALIDILCGAASADEHIAPQEIAVVEATLRKVLGVDVLPESAQPCFASFDRKAFDLGEALDRLAISKYEDGQALLDAAFEVVVADRFVDSGEYGFIAQLADELGLPMPRQLA